LVETVSQARCFHKNLSLLSGSLLTHKTLRRGYLFPWKAIKCNQAINLAFLFIIPQTEELYSIQWHISNKKNKPLLIWQCFATGGVCNDEFVKGILAAQAKAQ